MARKFTPKLSAQLDRAVYETERNPASIIWHAWRRLVEWWIFGGKL